MSFVTPGKLKEFKSLQDAYNDEKFASKADLTPELNKIQTKLAQCIYVKDRHLYLGAIDEE